MQGARKYAPYFKTGQYGRLYIVSGSHARGTTFHIQVLPAGEIAKENGPHKLCVNRDAVEVYGIIPGSGQPGWTEQYGWLHTGRWQDDFHALLAERKKKHEEEAAARSLAAQKSAESVADREKALLATY